MDPHLDLTNPSLEKRKVHNKLPVKLPANLRTDAQLFNPHKVFRAATGSGQTQTGRSPVNHASAPPVSSSSGVKRPFVPFRIGQHVLETDVDASRINLDLKRRRLEEAEHQSQANPGHREQGQNHTEQEKQLLEAARRRVLQKLSGPQEISKNNFRMT